MNILVVDDDRDFKKYLEKNSLESFKIILSTNKQYIFENAFKFNCIFIEMSIFNNTGLQLARMLLSMNPNLNIVLISNFISDFVVYNAIGLGIIKCVEKPLTIDKLLEVSVCISDFEQIEVLCDGKVQVNKVKEKIKEIENCLIKCGFSSQYLGFKYLVSAIEFSLLNDAKLVGMSKVMYLEIAYIYNTTPWCVERNIRSAVTRVCEGNNKKRFEEILSMKISKNHKPSNMKVISELTMEILRLERQVIIGKNRKKKKRQKQKEAEKAKVFNLIK